MSVLKIKDKDGKWVGVTAIQGEKGEQGYSPAIVVETNNSNTYKLRVTTEDRDFITPNLKGGGSAYGGGNSNPELGTIDNYKDFDGENIPPYNMDLPPLPMFRGGTRYAFETPVVMRVYNGTKDSNGNHDIDEYYTYESEYNEETGMHEVVVKTIENGFLTDYLIYNPIPKKEWDTWENPNILKILPVTSWKIGYEYKKNTIAALPNCGIKSGNDYIFHSGEAYIYYNKYKNILGDAYQREGDYGMAVYNRRDFPFILDELPQVYSYNNGALSNGVTIPWADADGEPSAEWRDRLSNTENTWWRCGESAALEYQNLGCCGDIDEYGNLVLMRDAVDIRDNKLLDTPEYDWVIANPKVINNILPEYGAKPIAPAMYVGLKKNKHYVIETTAAPCALVFPHLGGRETQKFITKALKVQYPSSIKTEVVKKADANSFADAQAGTTTSGSVGAGAVQHGSKLTNGTIMYFQTVDTSAKPLHAIEVPCALSCPNKYLQRGESYKVYIDDDGEEGMYILCENEDDYKGIKITEGIEPYSLLMEERMASGATKFNLKVYTDMFDRDDIKAEYNIKLSDNTTEDSYCRYLENHTIKHYDLDVFTMVGHKHTADELSDKEEFVESLQIPKMRLSTATLVDGVSELPENTFYFVYNE
jgi:hypothetical protein